MITGYTDNNVGPKEAYKSLIIKLVEILCEKKYRKIAKDYVGRDYFPLNESLAICEKKGVTDACAILYKRKGEFKTSISLYIEVLTNLSKDKVISAVYINANVPFLDPEVKDQSIKRFDEIMSMIIDICDKCGSRLLEKEAEELWLFSIDMIYTIKQQVMDELCDLDEKDLLNFQTFLLIRIQAFMMRMAEYVNLDRIIIFLEKIN